MMNKRLFFFVSIGALAAVACGSKSSTTSGTSSSSSSTTSSSTTSSSTGAGGSVMFPPESCVQAGEVGNSKGVGHSCTPGGHECDAFPEAGLCLADVGQKQWFCTQLGCMMDKDCGEMAACFHDQQNACIPAKCNGGSGGAGGTGGSPGTGGMGTGGKGGAGGH